MSGAIVLVAVAGLAAVEDHLAETATERAFEAVWQTAVVCSAVERSSAEFRRKYEPAAREAKAAAKQAARLIKEATVWRRYWRPGAAIVLHDVIRISDEAIQKARKIRWALPSGHANP